MPFTVSDLETAAGSLSVSGSSSNTTLIPNANISFGGSNGNRTVSIMPAANETGSAVITVTVSDGVASSSDTFTVVVSGVNDLPTISDIANQSSNEDTANQVVFTVADTETSAGSLTVTASSSNTSLIPNANLVLGGSGGSRTLTATPVANASGSATITVTVRDAVLAAATDTYVLTVAAINDAPQLTAIANGNVTELSSFNTSAVVTDPDDANDGSGALTFSLTTAPPGMTISAVGAISWTPGQNTAGSYPVTVRVADGGENGAAAANASFTVTVAKLDTDTDTVADYLDNCPNTANTDQANNDADGQGDACDTDDDNDGLPDAIELARGLDPFDPSDAAGDLDGDGLTNLQEYQTCVANNDPICDAIAVDSVAPVITTNGDLTVVATGYVTEVGETASAEDGVSGEVSVSADQRGPFRPGYYELTWTAQDAAGNVATAVQQVRVLPLVQVPRAMLAGEGQIVRVPVQLNGDAPEYPVQVIYTVSGTAGASDHSLQAGSVTIAAGTEALLEFTTTADAAVEADETIVVQLSAVTGNAALSEAAALTLTIVDRPVAPSVSLQLAQAGDPSQALFTNGGTAVATANAVDANNDVLTYLWQLSDESATVVASGNQLQFNPSELAVGAYTVSVTVNDGRHAVQASLPFVVVGSVPTLSDASDSDADGVDDLTEGLADSDGDGALDYRDPVNSTDELQIAVTGADLMTRLMRTEAGTRLQIGAQALAHGRQTARVISSDLTDDNGDPVVDPTYTPIGEIYDFRVSGLSDVNPDARVIIPLAQTIPPEAVYRKLRNGSWTTFSTSAGDEIHSAPMVDNRCPGFDDAAWQAGVNRGDGCLRLRIRDGGLNDADGVINGMVADPGVVSVARSAEQPRAPTDGPNGGGGAMPWWLIGMMMVTAAWLSVVRHRTGSAA